LSEIVHTVPDGFNARIGPDELAVLHELAERIALLQAEIARLEAARTAKSASMTAASAFFKS